MRNRFVKPLFVVLCITGVLLLDLGTPAPGRSEEFWNGTVTANVNLRKAPSIRGTIVKGLLKGSPVKIYEEQDGWYRVSAQKYHQVFKGWVSTNLWKSQPRNLRSQPRLQRCPRLSPKRSACRLPRKAFSRHPLQRPKSHAHSP